MELIKVDFKNDKLDIIEETQSIVVKDICEHIGLRFRTQYEKIKADESFESKLIKVQTRGGLQEVFTIPLSKLNGWLFNINPNKVKPEVKQKLIEYKKECFNVLNNYFNQGVAINHRLSSEPDLQKVIAGLKSGMLRKDKKIERLEDEIQQLKISHQKRTALPHFNQNQKIDIILRNTENLLKQDNILPFQDMVKVRFDFMRDYIEAIRTGGTKLEQFTINTIEDYKNKYINESKRRVLVEHKYNLMIDKVREYIKVANQLSLLEPIGGAL